YRITFFPLLLSALPQIQKNLLQAVADTGGVLSIRADLTISKHPIFSADAILPFLRQKVIAAFLSAFLFPAVPEVTISTVLGLIRRLFPSIRFPRLHPACLSIPVLPGTCPLLPRPQYSSTVQIRAGTPVSHLQQSTISFLSTSFSTQKGRSWKAHGCPQTPNPIVSIL